MIYSSRTSGMLAWILYSGEKRTSTSAGNLNVALLELQVGGRRTINGNLQASRVALKF